MLYALGVLMLPFLDERMMWSAARNASAEIVHVGWLRALVTKLLPSTTNRLGTSCALWNLSTTDVFGSFPMRHPPIVCPIALSSRIGDAHFLLGPDASISSIMRSVKNCLFFISSG